MSETKHPILSLNGHTLVDQEARNAAAQSAAAAAANAEEIGKLSEEIVDLETISGSAHGTNILLTDNGTATIKSLTVTAAFDPQNVATPENIIPVGVASGIVATTEDGESVLVGSNICAAIPPAGLESYANYVDAEGKMYISDVRDYKRGVDERHLAKLTFTGSTAYWNLFYNTPGVFSHSLDSKNPTPCAGENNNVRYVVQSSHYRPVTRGELYNNLSTIHDTHNYTCGARARQFVISDSRFKTVGEFCAYLGNQYEAGTPVEVVYVPNAVTETAIPEREIDEFESFVLPAGSVVKGQHEGNFVNVEYWKDFIGKEYVDEKTKNVGKQSRKYVTPEDFGAYGDETQDDSAAIEQCIQEAASSGLPIKMYGRYKVSRPVELSTNNGMNVEINAVLYTGTDAAVRLAGRNNILSVGKIVSNGVGICVYTNGANCFRNTISVGEIISDSYCIMLNQANKGIWQNRIDFASLSTSNSSACIYSTKPDSGGFCGENTYRGGQCVSGLWAFDLHEGNSKIENVQFEGVSNGVRMENCNCMNIYGCRYAELLYRYEGVLLKLVGDNYSHKFSGNAMIYQESIDVSEMSMAQSAQSGAANLGSVLTRIDGIIGVKSGPLVTDRTVLAERAYVQQNDVVYAPFDKQTATINQTPYHTITTDYRLPDVFVVGIANCVINLDRSYVSFAHNDIIIDQRTDGMTAKVFNYKGDLIFDGDIFGSGVYRLICTRTDQNSFVDNSNETWHVYKQD